MVRHTRRQVVNPAIKLLQTLKPHKASGAEAQPARLLRDLAQGIGPILIILFQQILNTTGAMPQLPPLTKGGNRHISEKYRQVCSTNEHLQ